MGSKRKAVDWMGVSLFGVAAGTTFALGSWQVKRYFWKVGLVEERKEQLVKEPIALADLKEPLPYTRVFGRGTFAYDQSVFVGPRSPPAGRKTGTAMKPSGFYVVTPFTEASNGKQYLVNRGWVQRDKPMLAYVEEKPDSNNLVAIEAVVGVNESGGTFTPDNSKQDDMFLFVLDSKSIGKIRNLPEDTLLLDQIDGPGPVLSKSIESFESFKVPPVTHVGYAATWYGLCGTGLYMIKRRFF
mmetsp:Transcript_6930/g.10971  ORF Transcript_6930/g.10971 Transcript_6930/m.10971 type:complete len:242 (-) Transcript_6930:1416-2141(-)|eukprot:CAMPEP_0203773638 /NCGR_PEP_ID=MMETSP0099_2-20121227/4777_1 /ASSEMBLY_ACC=CAM_ASM_000209 /TAXON_ID=96639 /ORGANISM=" , Strain NY0313808BC1" /LENGTH=241 /DNA_ID=CAMNT_0050671507 /DNA_START=260 /DNA_END=988 /DNA_ORIENTATION=-